MANSNKSSSNIKYEILRPDNISQEENEQIENNMLSSNNNAIEGIEELTLSEFLNSVITDNSDKINTDDEEILLSDNEKCINYESNDLTSVSFWEGDNISTTVCKEVSKFNEIQSRSSHYLSANKNKYDGITDFEDFDVSSDDENMLQQTSAINLNNPVKFGNFLEMSNFKMYNIPEKLSWKLSASSSIDADNITETEDLSDKENNFIKTISCGPKKICKYQLTNESDSDAEEVFLPSDQFNKTAYPEVKEFDEIDNITDTEYFETKENENFLTENSCEPYKKPFSLPDLSQCLESHSKQLLTVQDDDFTGSKTDEENFITSEEEETEKEEKKILTNISTIENQTSIIKIKESESLCKESKCYNRNKIKKNNYTKKSNPLVKQKAMLPSFQTNYEPTTDIENLSDIESPQYLNSNHYDIQKHQNKTKCIEQKRRNWSNKLNKNTGIRYKKLAESSSSDEDEDNDKDINSLIESVKTDEEELNNSENEELSKHKIYSVPENDDEIAELCLNSITIVDSSPETDTEELICENNMNMFSNIEK